MPRRRSSISDMLYAYSMISISNGEKVWRTRKLFIFGRVSESLEERKSDNFSSAGAEPKSSKSSNSGQSGG